MLRLRLTRPARAAGVTACGLAGVTAGTWIAAGAGPGLVVGGALVSAYGSFVMDADEPEQAEPEGV